MTCWDIVPFTILWYGRKEHTIARMILHCNWHVQEISKKDILLCQTLLSDLLRHLASKAAGVIIGSSACIYLQAKITLHVDSLALVHVKVFKSSLLILKNNMCTKIFRYKLSQHIWHRNTTDNFTIYASTRWLSIWLMQSTLGNHINSEFII